MIFDTITIICSISILLLAFISSLCNPFFRKPILKEEDIHTKNNPPKFSIVITANDNAKELEDNLPVIISQQYEPGFEIIIVTGASEYDTEEILNNFKKHTDNLYTTFIPDSSRYMSRKKLAITLGIKASKNEWIILIDATCKPNTDLWLQAISKQCNSDNSIILGYSNYDDSSNDYYRFSRLRTEYYLMKKAQTGTAYRATGHTIAFRKSKFMEHNGFLRNLKYERGEFDFIVNELAERENTNISTEPDAWVREDSSYSSWHNDNMYYMETRRHLMRSISYRILYDFDMSIMYLNYIVSILLLSYSIFINNWILTIATSIAIVYSIIIRIILAKKAINRFEENINALKIIPFELKIIWSRLFLMLKYAMTDKSEFIRK